jgi:hypothetical protein
MTQDKKGHNEGDLLKEEYRINLGECNLHD